MFWVRLIHEIYVIFKTRHPTGFSSQKQKGRDPQRPYFTLKISIEAHVIKKKPNWSKIWFKIKLWKIQVIDTNHPIIQRTSLHWVNIPSWQQSTDQEKLNSKQITETNWINTSKLLTPWRSIICSKIQIKKLRNESKQSDNRSQKSKRQHSA